MSIDITALPARFIEKVDFNGPGGCWLWLASRNHRGYGRFYVSRGMHTSAYRYSFEQIRGEVIPDEMVLDHMCSRRECVNPWHLRIVTPRQNAEHRRGANSNSKSGVRGVYWNVKAGKWQVLVAANGVRHFGGRFDVLDEAAQVAISMRKELFTHAER